MEALSRGGWLARWALVVIGVGVLLGHDCALADDGHEIVDRAVSSGAEPQGGEPAGIHAASCEVVTPTSTAGAFSTSEGRPVAFALPVPMLHMRAPGLAHPPLPHAARFLLHASLLI